MTTENKDARDADLSADVSVDDTEMDSGVVVEETVRYRDPVTKRFAKRPTEEGDNQSDEAEAGPHETARDRIAKQFQELRQQQAVEEEDFDEPAAVLPKQLKTGMTDEEVDEQIELSRAEQKAAEAPKPEAPVLEPPKVAPAPAAPLPLMIVVDGQMMQVDRNDPRWAAPTATDDQVRSVAQLRLAAERRFAEAKANQVSNQTGEGQQPAHQRPAHSQEPTDTPGAHTRTLDRDKLGEIADRIQYGNRDEATDALNELTETLASVASKSGQRDIQQEVQQVLANQQNRAEIEGAVSTFEKENSDLTSNKHLQTVILDVAVETMTEDMRAIGVPEEALMMLQGKGELVSRAYHNLRQEGYPLKSYGDLLNQAGSKVREVFKMPRSPQPSEPNKPTIEKRVEQKRNMQQQPRSAGVRQAPAQTPRPLTRAEIIQQAKRQRMPWAT